MEKISKIIPCRIVGAFSKNLGKGTHTLIQGVCNNIPKCRGQGRFLLEKHWKYIAKKVTSDTSSSPVHAVHMKVFIPHIYGSLNTNLQHMVSFFRIVTKPGASGALSFFQQKKISGEFFRE